jgi:hypothetical protein
MDLKDLKAHDERISKLVKESKDPHGTLFNELMDLIREKQIKEMFESEIVAVVYHFCMNLKMYLYHDFRTPHTAPKVLMHAALMDMDLHSVSGLVKEGIFDEDVNQTYTF